jgi:hypothetical protein
MNVYDCPLYYLCVIRLSTSLKLTLRKSLVRDRELSGLITALLLSLPSNQIIQLSTFEQPAVQL